MKQLYTTIGIAVGVMLLPGCKSEAAAYDATPASLRVGVVVSSDASGSSATRGALLGTEEAGRTGALLGRQLTVEQRSAADRTSAVHEAASLIDGGATAIVGGFDMSTCLALDSLVVARSVVFINVGCREDEFRARASPHTFHVQASDSMYLRALVASRGAGGRAPLLWHPALARYGAAQLNARFVRRFGVPADASAWAGWMAIKVLWEASNQSDFANQSLAERLLLPDAEFDGHKGEGLRFDAATRQLRQPLFAAPAVDVRSVPRAAGMDVGTAVTAAEAALLRDAYDAAWPLVVVTNEGSSTVSVLNATTGLTLASLQFSARPRGVQVSADARRAWIAMSDDAPTSQGDGDGIVELDLREGRITARYPAGSDPEQFAVARTGSLLLAANEDAGTATLMDMRTGVVRATLLVGIEPEGVALAPDDRVAYVTAETSNTVSVIQCDPPAVIASFLVDERPRAVAFAPDGRRAYVTNEISGTLSVIDVARHAVIGSIVLAEGRARPVGVVVSPDSRWIYVANGHANSISVVDASTMRETAVVAVGRRPWGLSLSADGTRLYAANGGTGDVSVIDTQSRTVIARFPVGDRPWGVAVTR